MLCTVTRHKMQERTGPRRDIYVLVFSKQYLFQSFGARFIKRRRHPNLEIFGFRLQTVQSKSKSNFALNYLTSQIPTMNSCHSHSLNFNFGYHVRLSLPASFLDSINPGAWFIAQQAITKELRPQIIDYRFLGDNNNILNIILQIFQSHEYKIRTLIHLQIH